MWSCHIYCHRTKQNHCKDVLIATQLNDRGRVWDVQHCIIFTPIRVQKMPRLNYRKEKLPIPLESYTKTYIVFGPRKVIQSNPLGNISYKPGRQIGVRCQVFPKNCSYLASNNVNSFSFWAYRIPHVNSSISPFSPTSLRAGDAIIFLAPTSFSPHLPSFGAQ